MSEPSKTIYLITGANRGIGLALVADIAAKFPSAIIYAGARDRGSASQLKELAAKYPRRIEVVKCVSGDKEGNESLAKEIGDKHGRVDVVIANAGIANCVAKVHETPIHQFEDHFSVNVVGTIVLFQAVYALLKASPLPRFVAVSSGTGSLLNFPPLPIDVAAYGASKAALNWVARKIHFENEWLVCFPICPGAVDTDMAQHTIALDKTGKLAEYMDNRPRPAPVAAGMLAGIIARSTREAEGGQFVNVEGKRHSW